MTDRTNEPGAEVAAFDAPVDPARITRRLDVIFRDSLTHLAVGLAPLFILLAAVHHFTDPEPAASIMPWVNLATALLFAGFAVAVRRWPVRPEWAHGLAFAVVIVVLANTWVNVVLIPEPFEALDLVLIVVGAGLLLLSTPWFVATAALVWVSFGALVWRMPDYGGWTRLVVVMLASTVIASAAFGYRVRAYRHLELLRIRDHERQRELERSNAELEQFAYVASHDLQEPLRMVESYLGLLERRAGDKLTDDEREFLDYATDGAQRMRGLIRALLEYSRAGTRGAPPEPVNASSALNRALGDLGPATREAGATLELEELPTVMADGAQLAQVFQNLVGNAIKYRGEAPPRVRVSAARENGEWVFTVADNGIGVPAEHAERVFEPFQRLHTREEYEGTGIGLALCKKIIERHGGRIWVESAPGEGATFRFSLPVAPEP